MTAPYARREVTLIALLGAAATAAAAWFLGAWAILPAVLTLALLAFHRDPARQPPPGDNLVLAPADGKVVEICRAGDGPDGARLLRITVFLSVFDVHVNRSPCTGRVTAVSYRPGEFLNALRSAASTRNESNTLTMQPAPPLPGPVRVRQIAGVLARRIVCTARVGDHLTAGQRFGMIKLGSRTEVGLVEDPRWEVLVRTGDQVKAGLTVLARLRTTSAT
jgi:phosphatidylserine decarboxylase